jgi:hypothetical protein
MKYVMRKHTIEHKDPFTIYSPHPDLTFCFQQTVLAWIPCAFVWLAAPSWIYMLTKLDYKFRFSWLFLLKYVRALLIGPQ